MCNRIGEIFLFVEVFAAFVLQSSAVRSDHQVLIGMRKLGKENLLVALATYFDSWVVVSPESFETLQVLEMQNVFSTNPNAGRIHAVPYQVRLSRCFPTWLKLEREGERQYFFLPVCVRGGSTKIPFFQRVRDSMKRRRLCEFKMCSWDQNEHSRNDLTNTNSTGK